MAINANQGNAEIAALLKTSPEKYVSLGDLIDPNKPDNRDLLIQTYGDQGITGFLELTGAVKNAGTNDQVQYWEEGRLHKTVVVDGDISSAIAEADITVTSTAASACRVNDVLLTPAGVRLVVKSVSGTTITAKNMSGLAFAGETAPGTLPIVGNIYAQGTSQPTSFYQTDVQKRTNDFLITKETYQVNGSQATNIGWINVGNGDYRWYVKGEMDTRKRFMNQREMMMLLAERFDSTLVANDGADGVALASENQFTGSEGYFSAVEDRGISTTGSFDSMADMDSIILLLDKQGAPSEYAMYVNTQTSLNMDDMVASGIATSVTAGLPGQFGAFQNSPDMAVQLGFKSFTRGGYTFHKHDWKLLNDPTLLGAFGTPLYKGAMVPMAQVADAKTGVKAPALEMNYKAANGYSREMEHWVTGGGVLGYATDGDDLAKFNYRSECNLITRAANKHVVLKS